MEEHIHFLSFVFFVLHLCYTNVVVLLFCTLSRKNKKAFGLLDFHPVPVMLVLVKMEPCLKKVNAFRHDPQQSLLFMQLPSALGSLHLAEPQM